MFSSVITTVSGKRYSFPEGSYELLLNLYKTSDLIYVEFTDKCGLRYKFTFKVDTIESISLEEVNNG